MRDHVTTTIYKILQEFPAFTTLTRSIGLGALVEQIFEWLEEQITLVLRQVYGNGCQVLVKINASTHYLI